MKAGNQATAGPRPRPGKRLPDPLNPPPFVPTGEDRQRGVLFVPDAHLALRRGVDTMTAALAVTLGPLGRTVIVASHENGTAPEVLADAATIARRTVRIPNRYQNAGAMLIRYLAWHMRETVGDGSATSAVLARARGEGTVWALSLGGGLWRGLRAGLPQRWCRFGAVSHHPS